MPTRSNAIKKFLKIKTHLDLANLYNMGMECQINVAQNGGERIDGEFKGRRWQGWTDGLTTWKSFRIPLNAYSEPEDNNYEIRFNLAEHVEGIGMTGWDWKHRISKWVAFDFDSLIGHSGGLTNTELKTIEQSIYKIDWVTIRKSTSGQGLHVYVFINNIPTKNHTEHAALARAILGNMSALTGFDFRNKVDTCGGNMWVWHRKMINTQGLKLIKKGSILKDIPPNWRDHLKVIKGHRKKSLPHIIPKVNQNDFEELSSQNPKIELDEEHQKLIDFLKSSNTFWWWDSDHHMLVTHTTHLADAYTELGLRGYYKTISKGKEKPNDHNCYLFPLRKGAWTVRRYSPGVQEHESWEQDGQGWTRCYLNKDADLATACRAYGGLEDPKGGWVFREAEIAIKAADLLGIKFDVATYARGRKTKLKKNKDGKLIIEVNHDSNDLADQMPGWLSDKGKWSRVFQLQAQEQIELEMSSYEDMIRHLITSTNEDFGWVLKIDGTWCVQPLTHIKTVLGSLGLNNKELTAVLGGSIFKCWKLVNKPFQSEYPGGREWNRNAAQLRFLPTQSKENLNYPTWLKILNHIGEGLNEAISQSSWAKANSILSGADYFKCWIASLFQNPLEPLPYLFFYGPQNSGKSVFHEALSLLLTKGYKRADAALISGEGYNAELEGSIICVIEETNLGKNKGMAYDRIKDWVTGRELLIHAKYQTPYHVPNTTHWIQCANDHKNCPIFAGDTRITMVFVESLINLIPKREIIPRLEKEASDFLAEILRLELPTSPDRLNVPVINTEDKTMVEQFNQTVLEQFIKETCRSVNGYTIKFSDFYNRFIEQLDPSEYRAWSKTRVGREIPLQYLKGRLKINNQVYIGNITWAENETMETKNKLKLQDGWLI